MTGYTRAEVMQRSACTEFLHGPMTAQSAVAAVKEALIKGLEKHFEILYYRKTGEWCPSTGRLIPTAFWPVPVVVSSIHPEPDPANSVAETLHTDTRCICGAGDMLINSLCRARCLLGSTGQTMMAVKQGWWWWWLWQDNGPNWNGRVAGVQLRYPLIICNYMRFYTKAAAVVVWWHRVVGGGLTHGRRGSQGSTQIAPDTATHVGIRLSIGVTGHDRRRIWKWLSSMSWLWDGPLTGAGHVLGISCKRKSNWESFDDDSEWPHAW